MISGPYLLDTNAISVTRNPDRHPRAAAFLSSIPLEDVFLSVITMGELERGVLRKRMRAREGVASLSRWVRDVEIAYAGRILVVDLEVAKVWAELTTGRTRPVADALLAATAIVHTLTLVTRNVADFQDVPVKLHNPWNE